MSLYGALQIGVAGLDAFSTALSTTSSNIANVNTVGYKASASSFSTLLASSDGTESGVVAKQAQLVTTQGPINGTQSPTDLAMQGNGFFVVSANSVPASLPSSLFMTSSVRLAGKIEERACLEKATFRLLVKPAATA